MANTIAMKAPVGFTGSVTMGQSTPPTTGQTYTPDANGMVVVDPKDVPAMISIGFLPQQGPTQAKIATADNGTTQTLTAAMVTGGGQEVVHVSAGGTTPTLTMPTGALMDAALPGFQVGQSFILRVINSNSGTATIADGSGMDMQGTLTLATNTWREFLITKTAAATFTGVSIGTGTNS